MAGTALRHPLILRAMLVTLLAGCAFVGVESIFGLWTQARFDWGPRQVGAAFAVVGIVAAFCQIVLIGPFRSASAKRGFWPSAWRSPRSA